MFNIAICDDDFSHCEMLRNFFRRHFCELIRQIEDFSNGQELLQDIRDNHSVYSFIFLDLDMPCMNGIDTGRALRKLPLYQNACIFFLTCYETSAASIVDLHPFAYLNKPLNFEKLQILFTKAVTLWSADEKKLLIPCKKATYLFPTVMIIYIASAGKKCELYFTNGDSCVINLRLSVLAELIPEESSFIKPHQSFIVNSRYITMVTSTHILIQSGIRIPISKACQPAFFAKFRQLFIH